MKTKRYLILILCFLIIFQFIVISIEKNNTYAEAIQGQYEKSLITLLLISSGLVFTSQSSLDSTSDSLYDHLVATGEISNLLWQGSKGIVKDFTTNTYKQVIEIKDSVWNTVKNWIDENFNAGENEFVEFINGWVEVPVGYLYGNNYYLNYGDNQYLTVLTYTSKYGYSYHLFNKQFEVDNLNIFFSSKTGSYNYYLKLNYIDNYNENKNLIITNHDSDINHDYHILKIAYKSHNNGLGITVDDSIDINKQVVSGTENIVDNPNYDWVNNFSGVRSISIPVDTAPDGNPALEEREDNRVFPVPWVNTDFGLDLTPEDIKAQDVSGVSAETGTIVETGDKVDLLDLTDVNVPTLEISDVGEIGDLELDTPGKRTLFQTKFPFCLPWDLKSLFTILKATPEAPRFEIDVVPLALKNKIGIQGETMFVLDMEDFALVGRMSRFFSFIGACLGLILVTRKIINS